MQLTTSFREKSLHYNDLQLKSNGILALTWRHSEPKISLDMRTEIIAEIMAEIIAVRTAAEGCGKLVSSPNKLPIEVSLDLR